MAVIKTGFLWGLFSTLCATNSWGKTPPMLPILLTMLEDNPISIIELEK
jgi:hypothetical protein